jgi:membrane-associated phospholipid phosphatase
MYLIRLIIITCLILSANTLKSQDMYHYHSPDSSGYSHSIFDKQNINHNPPPYALVNKRELFILGTGGILGISGLALISNIKPLTLDEIYQLDASDINGFDRKAVGTYQNYPADDLLLYGSLFLPLTFLSHEEMKRDWKTLGVIGFEVLLFQAGLNGVVKGLTQRIRPYVYDPNSPLDKKTSKTAKLSFYSGHTSTAAAMSFFTAKAFSDYLPNGPTKSLIWTGAVIYPALVGYLRVASASHFPTDVIVGYTVGALVGYFIPQLHKVDREDGLSVFPSLQYNTLSINALYSF